MLEGMSRKNMGFSTPKQEVLESSPPPHIKNSPKYADHPPNAGHGFAALSRPLRGMWRPRDTIYAQTMARHQSRV